jgi:hypothetical protein
LDLFINIEQKDDIRMHLMPTLGVAFGSIATEIGCPRDIRFSAESDRMADIPDRRLRANKRHAQIAD